uniref:Putative insect pheromone/odorant binding protein n=1 Tax=Culex tarsalis TaxID=7177 RepID=A0A1Q3FTB8_CULTA
MKVQIVFSILCLGCCCLAALNPEQARILGNLAKSCYPELGLPEDSDMLLRAVKNELTYTEEEVKFLVCVGRKYDLLDAEGKFKTQRMKDFLLKSNAFERQDVIDVIDQCFGQREESTLEERAQEAYKCFQATKKFSIV